MRRAGNNRAMKWLITTPAGVDLSEIWARLAALGCSADENQEPIPLDDTEQVIQVDGPRDLPKRTAGEPRILKVHPDSELTLY